MCEIKNSYMSFTLNLFKRAEWGCPFISLTILILALLFDFSFVFIPDYIEDQSVAGGVLLTILLYFLVILSYWWFIKVVFSNPGDVPPHYEHPLKQFEPATNPTDEEQKAQAGQAEDVKKKEEEKAQKDAEAYTLIVNQFKAQTYPENYKGDNEGSENTVQLSRDSKMGRKIVVANLRYRRWAIWNNDKLPRAHHWRSCNRCILKMDHHCPFMGNCIGYHNHKQFILFNFYISLAQIVYFVLLCFGIKWELYGSDKVRLGLGYITPLVIVFLFGFATCSLWIGHFTMALLNVTTLESYVSFYVRPFSKGSWLENLKDVFGNPKCKLMWLLPTDPFPKDDERNNSGTFFDFKTY